MRGGSINGPWEFGELICPTCFMVLAEERGIASGWRLHATEVHAELETTTPSGRVWDDDTDLWKEAPMPNQADAERRNQWLDNAANSIAAMKREIGASRYALAALAARDAANALDQAAIAHDSVLAAEDPLPEPIIPDPGKVQS